MSTANEGIFARRDGDLAHAWNDATDGSLCGAVASGAVPVGSQIRPWDENVTCPGCLSLMSAIKWAEEWGKKLNPTSETIELESEEIVTAIKQRAKLLADDNISHPTPSDYLIIESAMMIGASVALEIQGKTL